jgi:hypothetical protein
MTLCTSAERKCPTTGTATLGTPQHVGTPPPPHTHTHAHIRTSPATQLRSETPHFADSPFLQAHTLDGMNQPCASHRVWAQITTCEYTILCGSHCRQPHHMRAHKPLYTVSHIVVVGLTLQTTTPFTSTKLSLRGARVLRVSLRTC